MTRKPTPATSPQITDQALAEMIERAKRRQAKAKTTGDWHSDQMIIDGARRELARRHPHALEASERNKGWNDD
jgi:hypothetical protein